MAGKLFLPRDATAALITYGRFLLPLARVRRRHGRNRRDAQRLPDSFVVGKEECSILQDWSADRSSKLVALEGRNTTHIEEVPGVEFAITKKLVHTAVNLICPRARNGVNHPPGGLAVLRRVVAGQDGTFLNRVNAQVPSQHAAGCSIGVVIEADAIQTIIILLCPGAGASQLLSKTAISSIGARRKVGLGVNRINTGL